MTIQHLILYAGLAVAAIAFVRGVFAGWNAKKKRREDHGSVSAHRKAMILAFYCMWGFVVLIELIIRLTSGVERLDMLFALHLCFALPFLLVFFPLTIWVLNGEKSRHHAKSAYATIVFFLCTVATGIPLIHHIRFVHWI